MRRWLLHIVVILSAVFTAAGQAIAPDGTTNWSNSHLITTNGNEAFAVTYDADRVYDLKHWDVGGWYDVATIDPLPKHGLNPDGEFVAVDVIQFENKIFVTGKYYIDLSGSAVNYVVAWDGDQWVSYNDTLISGSSDITKFLIHNGDLLLMGMFGGKDISSNLLKLGTDNSWTEFGDLLTKDDATDYINDAIVHNGLIYASGGFGQGILASFNNGKWGVITPAPFLNMCDNFTLYKGNLVLFGKPTSSTYDYFKKLVGGSWANISNGLEETEVVQLNNMVQSGDYIWATGEFRDLGNSELFSIMYYNGTSWIKAETGQISNDLFTLSLLDQPYVYGNFDYQGTTNFGRIYPDRALLTGSVFEDIDGNCIISSGDKNVSNAAIELTPGGYIFNLNSDGSYRIPVKKGNYTLRVICPDYWKTSCDPTKAIAVQENATYTGLNFGVEQIPGKVDLTGHLTDYNGWVLQSGHKDRVKLCVYNKGTAEAQNVEVVLNVDDRISGASFDPVPDQFDGKKAVWYISSIPAGSVLCFEMTSDIPGVSNEDLVFSYEINLDGIDENGSDNTGTTYFDLTNEGIEPISKATGNDREISLTEEFLLYKIRIHNISNSTIDRIVIRDTFDENIYLNKVWVNYSFEDQAVINIDYIEVEGNYQYIYTWTFDDAALVDSATDPLSSIGYLDVKIRLVPKMHPKGTEICNTAFVMAGNSEPVRTNTVCGSFGKVNIDETDPSLLQIRPNPANSSVLLSNPHNEKVNVMILSADGRVEMKLQILPFSTTEISVDHLSNGVYFINAEGYGSARFIKISN